MSEQNVELARTFHEAFNRDGWDALWRIADPDIEFLEPPEQPGASIFRGLDAVREGVVKSWQGSWTAQRSTAERFVDLGDRVLLLAVQNLRGRDGIEVTQPSAAILTFRDDKIIRFEAYWDQQTALKAGGIRE